MHSLRNKQTVSGGSATRASPLLRPVADKASSVQARRSAAAVRAQGPGSDPQVICFGEALFDFLADQKGLTRAEVKSWTPYPGGAPCNVATALQRLGTPTAFVSALGNDDRGEEIMALLKERGVDTSGVQRNDRPTRDIYAERTLDGDRVFAGFGRPTEDYCDVAMDAKQLPLDKIKSAKLLIMGTLGLAAPDTRAAMEAAVKAAHEGGCKVFVDINWRPVFWADLQEAKRVITDFLGSVDLVKISDADLEFLYEMDPDAALKDPCSVAQRLPKADGVLVTAGDKGAAYCFHAANKGEHTGFVPVFEVDVVDTTGAGDAFTAGFAYKLLEAGSIEHLGSNPDVLKKAVVFAAATGALTCTRPGAIAAQPSLEEVQALYEKSKAFDHLWNQTSAN